VSADSGGVDAGAAGDEGRGVCFIRGETTQP